MAKSWTAARDQRLFLLLVDQVKIDAKALATGWKTKYNDTNEDDYQPSESAISQHINALKRSTGGGSGKAPTPKPKATPRKPTAPKTPKSSAKRKRAKKSSDEDEPMQDGEDDTDAERKMLNKSPSAPRSTLSRRSKSVAKSYANDDSSEDDADADGEVEGGNLSTPAAFDGAADSAQLDQVVRQISVATADDAAEGINLTPQGKATNGIQHKSPTKRVKREVREDDESDVSEFTPNL